MGRFVRTLVTERDIKIFYFLWRWKVVSSQALAKKFFPGIQIASAYARLRKLEDSGCIRSLQVGRKQFAWGINKHGYNCLGSYGMPENHDGYLSEYPHHDFIVTAFHLGEWLLDTPSHVELYTEQELRCIPDDCWSEWIPQSTIHRPDGYTRIVNGERQTVFAFEVEISLKSKKRYEATTYYYNSNTSVNHVLWVAGTKGIAKSIQRIFERSNERASRKHSFALLEDFKARGWDAEFVRGEFKGKTINEVLNPLGITTPTLGHHARHTLSMLDPRGRPTIFRPYEDGENPKIANGDNNQ